MTGFIKVPRDLIEDVFRTPEYDEFHAFLWLVSKAQRRRKTVRFMNELYNLDRAQLVVTTRKTATCWGWSEARVRRCFKKWKEKSLIDCVADAGATIITICNYDEFSGSYRVTDAPTDAPKKENRRTADAPIYKGEREKYGGGRARAREPDSNLPADPEPPPEPPPEGPEPIEARSYRERLLMAMNLDPNTTVTATGKMILGREEMLVAEAWLERDGLPEWVVIEVISEITRGLIKRGHKVPTSVKYFAQPIARYVAEIEHQRNGGANVEHHSNHSADLARRAAANGPMAGHSSASRGGAGSGVVAAAMRSRRRRMEDATRQGVREPEHGSEDGA
ncbi:MAG: hypothetical protein AAFQ51_05400 [Pseudomonadota bacterium]